MTWMTLEGANGESLRYLRHLEKVRLQRMYCSVQALLQLQLFRSFENMARTRNREYPTNRIIKGLLPITVRKNPIPRPSTAGATATRLATAVGAWHSSSLPGGRAGGASSTGCSGTGGGAIRPVWRMEARSPDGA